MNFLGCPYPIKKHHLGLLHSQYGIEQIKSDLLILLLTNPGERVFLPEFGTPLRDYIFEPNDPQLCATVKSVIINSIAKWEPRITVESIEVTNSFDEDQLDPYDLKQDVEHILGIKIIFVDHKNIKEVQELKLEIPLSGV